MYLEITDYVKFESMRNKKTRLQLIVKLIKNNCVGSQDELAHLLATNGYIVTQATLSRDLKTLKATKVATDMGGYMYMIPDSNDLQDSMLSKGMSVSTYSVHSTSFISLQFSGHLAIIKTRNGYASGLAYDIDMSKSPEILGTVAGADTVIAVLREDISRAEAKKLFAKFLPLTADDEM